MDLSSGHLSQSLKHLVDLGTKGYFPLFPPSWADGLQEKNMEKLTKKEKQKAKKILGKLNQYDSLEKKKTVVWSLIDEDRELFIRSFLKLVEGEILDKRPELQ